MAQQQLKVFVSHNHEDDTFCRTLVEALRQAGADVWYDEHNMGAGQLMDVVQYELGVRPVFIIILSKAAFASHWVKRETTWAYELLDRDPTRILLPVTAEPVERGDFSAENGWLFLHDFRRIEASGYRPLPLEEATRRTLRVLALTPVGEMPALTAPEPNESVDDLVARGKALQAQGKHTDALPLLERATQLADGSYSAWFNLAYTLNVLERYHEALPAHERAIALDATSTVAWNSKGNALYNLTRYEEALAAYDHALALDPNFAFAWNNKGNALRSLSRYDDALAAYDRALALDAMNANVWTNKGLAFYRLGRYEEALAAYDRALALDETAMRWTGKGNALQMLKRYEEALSSYERAIAVDPTYALAWSNKGYSLRALGRTAEANQAEQHAKDLGG